MKLFDYDGPLSTAIRYICNLFLLNLCWLVCSLPIFTTGAATTALYSVYLNEGMESSDLRRFFSAFAANFRQATLIWLIMLGFGGLLCLDVYLLMAVQFPGNQVVFFITVLVAAVYLSFGSFVFPLQARYQNTLCKTLKNAFIFGFSSLLHGLLMTSIAFLPVILFFVNMNMFVDLLPTMVFFFAAVSTRVNTAIVRRVFRKTESQPQNERS